MKMGIGLNLGLGLGMGGGSVAYLLCDNFTTDLDAGDVNGTPAVPGPGGARTVTDTESKVSVASGKLTFSGGLSVPGYTDPHLVSSTAVTRALGRIFLAQINAAATSKQFLVGFGHNTSELFDEMAWNMGVATARFAPYESGAECAYIGIFAASTDYTVAIVLRANGGFWFIKGGTFTNWTLLQITSVNGTATLYPGILSNNAAVTSSFLRIPQQLWLPSPVASDSFNRADGAAGSTDGAGHTETTGLGSGGNGLAWTGAGAAIATNKLVITPTTPTELIANGTMELDSNWASADTPLANERSSEQKNGGSYSRKLTVNAAYEGIQSDVFVVAVGTWYQISRDIYGDGTNKATTRFWDNASAAFFPSPAGVVYPASWTSVLDIFRSTGAGNGTFRVCSGTGVATGTWYIDNVSVKALTLSTAFATLPAFASADQIATVGVTFTAGTQAGIVANLDSASTPANFIIAYLIDANGTKYVKVDECVAGTYTNKISGSITYSAGAELRLVRDGTYCAVYYNGELIGSATMSVNTGKIFGLFSTYSGNNFENLTIYPRGTSGEYSYLNKFSA